jgi:hypothetical protein
MLRFHKDTESGYTAANIVSIGWQIAVTDKQRKQTERRNIFFIKLSAVLKICFFLTATGQIIPVFFGVLLQDSMSIYYVSLSSAKSLENPG